MAAALSACDRYDAVTVFFRPDLSLPGDPAGWGRWLFGHYLEHQTFSTAAFNATPSISVQDYNLASWSDQKSVVTVWLNQHQNVHAVLRGQSGITGIDLSEVDLSDPDSFLEWMQIHSTEHQELRTFYGIRE